MNLKLSNKETEQRLGLPEMRPNFKDIRNHIGVYFRVSGSSQSIEMQKARAESWASENGYSWDDDIEKFNENALSANKIAMEDRPELMRLREAIKSGQITVLVVFARDRLARNFYEYMELVEEFIYFNIEIIFVGDTAPFSYDFLVEGVHGIHIQAEGKNIASRLKVVHQLYPPKKFGYTKVEDERRYVIDERYQNDIKSFFEEIADAQSFDQLCEYIKKYRGIFPGKSIEDCWQLLKTAFYAGHYPKNNEFFPLSHVPQIVSLELFKKAQAVLNCFERDFINTLKHSEEIGYFTPKCGICNQSMKHKKAFFGNSSNYQCSKHKSIQITVDELNDKIKSMLVKFINSIENDKIKKVLIPSVNAAIKKLDLNVKQHQETIEMERFNFYIGSKAKNPINYLEKVNGIEQEINELKRQIVNLSYTKKIAKKLEQTIKLNLLHKLETEELYNFILFLVEDIFVTDNAIDFNLYCTTFSRGVLHEEY